MTPSAAESPQDEPPDSTIASTCSTVMPGSSRALSRVPGAPPSTAIEAMVGLSNSATVTPVAPASS